MKKFLKIFGIVLVSIFVLLLVLPIFFKGKIIKLAQEQANNQLNAKVEFKDVSLSLIKRFPNISVEIEDICIAGVDTFANDTLLEMDKLAATLDIMSVISGDEIKVKNVQLNRPNVHIRVLENGKANYDIAKPSEEEVPEEASDSSSDFNLAIKKFEIKEANIDYNDLQSSLFAEINAMNFTLSGDMSSEQTKLNMKLLIEALSLKSGGIRYARQVRLEFISDIQADLKNQIYTIKDNSLSINNLQLIFNGNVSTKEEDILTDMTIKTQRTNFKDVLSLIPAVYKKDFNSVETRGNFSLNTYIKGVYNEKTLPAYGLKLKINDAYFKYPDLPKSVNNINIDLQVDAQEGSGEYIDINLKKAAMTIAGSPLLMHLKIKQTPGNTAMDGTLKGKANLENLKDIIPLEDTRYSGEAQADVYFKGNLSDIENEQYEKFDAGGDILLKNIHIQQKNTPEIVIHKTSMSLSPAHLNLKEFSSQIGKSDLRLSGTIDNLLPYVLKDDLLKGKFDFQSGNLNINELMSLSGEESAPPKENSPSTKDTPTEAILIPKNLDMRLHTKISAMQYNNLDISNIKGIVTIKNGVLDMQQLDMNLLGGSLQVKGVYDSKNEQNPAANLKLSAKQISISKTAETFLSVRKLAPVIESCIGNVSANLDLKTLFDKQMSPIMAGLTSMGNIRSKNISIANNKLFNLLASATHLNKFKSPKLRDLYLKFHIKDGKVIIEPTEFQLAGTRVKLSGSQSLDKKLDLNLGLKLPQNIASKILKTNGNQNTEITAKIGGTSDNPKLLKISGTPLDGTMQEVKEKVKEVKKVVKNTTKKALEEAQKKADKIIAEAERNAQNIRREARRNGDKVIAKAQKQKEKLVKQAGNPIAKRAARTAGDRLIKEARKQADNINAEADRQANKVVNTAKQKSDKIISQAQSKTN